MSDNCCFFTKGELYIADAKDFDPCHGLGVLGCEPLGSFKKLGNVVNARLNVSSEIIGTENKYNYFGLPDCSRINVQSVKLDLQIGCTKDSNLYKLIYAKQNESEALAFAQEHYCTDLLKDEFFSFLKSGVVEASLVVVVKDDAGVILQTLVNGVDFSFNTFGISLLNDLVIAGAFKLQINYDFNNQDFSSFDFFTELTGQKRLLFIGLNYADNEKPVKLEVFKVRLTPISGMDIISQTDFFTLQAEGLVERDHSRKTNGLGEYFELTRGNL